MLSVSCCDWPGNKIFNLQSVWGASQLSIAALCQALTQLPGVCISSWLCLDHCLLCMCSCIKLALMTSCARALAALCPHLLLNNSIQLLCVHLELVAVYCACICSYTTPLRYVGAPP